MKYRHFGNFKWKPSALGFGCMRFPTVEGSPLSGNIIENEAISMLRYAIEEGVNYVDTAYSYHSGNSEIVVGKALKEGYREKVKIATKSPVWLINKSEDFDKYLNEQLQKLQIEQIDFYLFHGLNNDRWKNIILKFNLLERAEEAIRDGRIKNIGFSFHDNYDVFKVIIDSYNKWNFCQIQYNYMGIDNQAGIKGLKYAASKGLGIIIMEPLFGGKLANPPTCVQNIFDRFERKRTPVDWALQWLWNQPEISFILSGMSDMNQVKENITSAKISDINSLDARDLELVKLVQKKYKDSVPVACTKCNYCMPCSQGINIPLNFEIYNNGVTYNDIKMAKIYYEISINENARASKCIDCKICESKCPQKIQIGELMQKVHLTLRK